METAMDISNAAVTNWDYQDVSNPYLSSVIQALTIKSISIECAAWPKFWLVPTPKTWNVCLPFSKGRALVSQPDVLAFGLFFCSFFSAIGGLVLLSGSFLLSIIHIFLEQIVNFLGFLDSQVFSSVQCQLWHDPGVWIENGITSKDRAWMWKRDALALKLLQPGDLGKGGIRFFLSARVCLTFACNVAQWQIRWSLGFRYRWMWRVLARIEVNDDRNQNAGIDRLPWTVTKKLLVSFILSCFINVNSKLTWI